MCIYLVLVVASFILVHSRSGLGFSVFLLFYFKTLVPLSFLVKVVKENFLSLFGVTGSGATSIRDSQEAKKNPEPAFELYYVIILCDHNIRGSLLAHMWIVSSLSFDASLHFEQSRHSKGER